MKTYKCRKISKGVAKGKALLSKDAVCFYTVEPETGIVIEKNHDIKGKVVTDTVLIIPSGKGSSVVQADGLYKLDMYKKAPAAIIVEHADPVLVSSVIIMNVPMVHKVDPAFYEDVKDGDIVEIDADAEEVRIY